MMFRKREIEHPISMSVAFSVTDNHGNPVNELILDRQTDGLMDLLDGVHTRLFRDLDVDAVLGQGIVTFTMEVIDHGADPQVILKELFNNIVPAIQSVGGIVDFDGPGHEAVGFETPVWHPEEPVLV